MTDSNQKSSTLEASEGVPARSDGRPVSDTTRWVAFGQWVAEECQEQPEEPQPLFRCDFAANATQAVKVHNDLCDELEAATKAAVKLAAEAQRHYEHASEMERQRNAFGEALTRIANGGQPAETAAQTLANLADGCLCLPGAPAHKHLQGGYSAAVRLDVPKETDNA